MIKCRVLSRFHQKVPLIYEMGGEFPYHMNLVHLISPSGLHREYYHFIGDDLKLCDDDNWEKIIIRCSRKSKYNF